jgi:hypothetical protein
MEIKESSAQQLNPTNHLCAHKVSRQVSPGIIEASLQLTTALFPDESGAADRLRRAYNACISGNPRIDDFEVMDYFIFTLGQTGQERVTGTGGTYRLVESSSTTDLILGALSETPPPGVSFLRNHQRDINEFLWGARFCVEPVSASSPQAMPFILLHIFSTAQALIESKSLAPVLLVFTRLNGNDGVQHLYKNLGFESIGVSLDYAEETQDVMCINLTRQAPVISRLEALTARARR